MEFYFQASLQQDSTFPVFKWSFW